MIRIDTYGPTQARGFAAYLYSGITGNEREKLIWQAALGDPGPALAMVEAEIVAALEAEVAALETRIAAPVGSVDQRIADIDRLVKLQGVLANRDAIEGEAELRVSAAVQAMESRSPDWRRMFAVQLRPDTSPEMLALLGLTKAGPLDQRTIANLMASRRADGQPITGRYYAVPRQGSKPVGFVGLSFSPGKSVTVAAVIGTPGDQNAIRSAHERAVATTLRKIEEQCGVVRVGRGGLKGTERGEIPWISFLHSDSHAGDPQLHTHVVIPNVVRSIESNRVGSLHLAKTHGRWRDNIATYHKELAANLQGAGFTAFYHQHNREAVIQSVPKELIELFSQRRKQILDYAQRGAAPGPVSEQERIRRNKRAAKITRGYGSKIGLLPEWLQRAAALGWHRDANVAVSRFRGREETHSLGQEQDGLGAGWGSSSPAATEVSHDHGIDR